MIERAIKYRPDATLLLHQCKYLHHLKQIHAHLTKIPADLTSFFFFAASSRNSAFFSYACALFCSLPCRTTFLYNVMIRGYMQSNQPENALLCYNVMLKEGLIRNNYTFTSLVKACSMIVSDFPVMGRLVHGHVVKLGFGLDQFVVNSLIEFYVSNLDMGAAEQLFNEMPVRDVVLWTVMIDGYGKIEEIEKARKMFNEMPERNVISWSAMVAAYSRGIDFREVLRLYAAKISVHRVSWKNNKRPAFLGPDNFKQKTSYETLIGSTMS